MYRVIIEKIEKKKEIKKGEWVKMKEVPVTREDWEKSRYHGNPNFEREVTLAPQYGYAPDQELEVNKEEEIYQQTVEDLNLANVIKAINNL